MKLIKDSILNKIQVAGEVNGALNDYNLVVVAKSQVKDADPVFAIYACQGEMCAGIIHEFGDFDHDTREEEGQQ